MLNDEFDAIRICAARALGEIGDVSSIQALIHVLGDWNSSVRTLATEALVKIGRPAVPALIKSLRHESIEVRRATVRALIEIPDVRAISALSDSLRDDDY